SRNAPTCWMPSRLPRRSEAIRIEAGATIDTVSRSAYEPMMASPPPCVAALTTGSMLAAPICNAPPTPPRTTVTPHLTILTPTAHALDDGHARAEILDVHREPDRAEESLGLCHGHVGVRKAGDIGGQPELDLDRARRRAGVSLA